MGMKSSEHYIEVIGTKPVYLALLNGGGFYTKCAQHLI